MVGEASAAGKPQIGTEYNLREWAQVDPAKLEGVYFRIVEHGAAKCIKVVSKEERSDIKDIFKFVAEHIKSEHITKGDTLERLEKNCATLKEKGLKKGGIRTTFGARGVEKAFQRVHELVSKVPSKPLARSSNAAGGEMSSIELTRLPGKEAVQNASKGSDSTLPIDDLVNTVKDMVKTKPKWIEGLKKSLEYTESFALDLGPNRQLVVRGEREMYIDDGGKQRALSPEAIARFRYALFEQTQSSSRPSAQLATADAAKPTASPASETFVRDAVVPRLKEFAGQHPSLFFATWSKMEVTADGAAVFTRYEQEKNGGHLVEINERHQLPGGKFPHPFRLEYAKDGHCDVVVTKGAKSEERTRLSDTVTKQLLSSMYLLNTMADRTKLSEMILDRNRPDATNPTYDHLRQMPNCIAIITTQDGRKWAVTTDKMLHQLDEKGNKLPFVRGHLVQCPLEDNEYHSAVTKSQFLETIFDDRNIQASGVPGFVAERLTDQQRKDMPDCAAVLTTKDGRKWAVTTDKKMYEMSREWLRQLEPWQQYQLNDSQYKRVVEKVTQQLAEAPSPQVVEAPKKQLSQAELAELEKTKQAQQERQKTIETLKNAMPHNVVDGPHGPREAIGYPYSDLFWEWNGQTRTYTPIDFHGDRVGDDTSVITLTQEEVSAVRSHREQRREVLTQIKGAIDSWSQSGKQNGLVAHNPGQRELIVTTQNQQRWKLQISGLGTSLTLLGKPQQQDAVAAVTVIQLSDDEVESLLENT